MILAVEIAIVGFILLLASVRDVLSWEVPNSYSLILLGIGLVKHFWYGSITPGLYGLALCLIIGYGFWMFDVWGAGDAKLLASLGFLFGITQVTWFLGLMGIAIAVIGLIQTFYNKEFKPSFVPFLFVASMLTYINSFWHVW